MKKAKDKFDDLVERIRKDEKVSFGQMEDVFAQAFLSRFLKRLSSDQERSKANQFYREHLVEDDEERYEDEEQPELTSDQQIHYELEVARSVMGTLGVRPSTEDLSHYIEHAVRGRDWKLLDKVLSLTQEGTMGKGVIEKVALEDLVRGRDSSYSELKEHFGDLRFSEEMIRPLYEQAFSVGDFKGIERLKNETHMPIPEEICQATYESILGNFSEQTIPQLLGLRQASGVSPIRTETVVNNLTKVFSATDLAPEAIDSLDSLFGIYPHKTNTAIFQRAALDGGHLMAFAHLYERSEGKIAAIRLQDKYKEWDAERKFDEIIYVLERTGASSTREVMNDIYNYLFDKGEFGFGKIREFIERTGKKPEFDNERINHAVDSVRRGTSVHLSDAKKLLDVLQLSKNGLDERIVQELGLELFRRTRRDFPLESFEQAYKEVQDFFSSYKVNPPAEIASVALYLLATGFTQRFNKLEKEYTSSANHEVLVPHKGMNLKQYHQFRGKVSTNLKDCIRKAKDITKKNKGTEIQDNSAIQEAYTRSLELVLVQCERSEEDPIRLGELSRAIGIQISRASVVNALSRHIKRYASYSESQEGLLSKVAETVGIETKLDESDIHQIVTGLLREKGDQYFNRGSWIDYAARLTGRTSFSEETREQIKASAVNSLLNSNFAEYDALAKYLDDGFQFSREQVGTLRTKVKNILRSESISRYNELQRRVSQSLVETADARTIAADLLDLPNDFSRYDQLKERFAFTQDFTIDEEKRIRERAITRLKESPALYRKITELNKRTGFSVTATPEELKAIIEVYFRETRGWTKPQEIAASLNQQLDPEQIQKRYVHLMERAEREPGTRYEAQELRKDTGIPLNDTVVRDFVLFKRYSEAIRWLSDFNRTLGYVPSNDYKNELFRQAFKDNSYDGIKDLVGICKTKPDADLVRNLVLRDYKPIEERIRWLQTFTDISAGFFELTPGEAADLYRQAYTPANQGIKNVGALMNITKQAPPEGIARQILDRSMQRHNYGLLIHDWDDKENRAVDDIVSSLTGEYKARLGDEQVRQINEYLSQRTSLKSVADTIKTMSSKYHQNPELTEEQQRRLLRVVEQTVSQAYTRIKKSGDLPNDYYWQEKFLSSVLFTHESVRQETATRAAELLASENIFQGLVYMKATGTSPNFTPAQFDVFKQNMELYQNRFSQRELKTLQSLAEKLKPEVQ